MSFLFELYMLYVNYIYDLNQNIFHVSHSFILIFTCIAGSAKKMKENILGF